jgi:hypothetical protein
MPAGYHVMMDIEADPMTSEPTADRRAVLHRFTWHYRVLQKHKLSFSEVFGFLNFK